MKYGAAGWLLAVTLSAVGCGDSGTRAPPALSFAASTMVFPDTVIDRVASDGIKAIAVTNVGGESLTPTFALASDADFTIKTTTCNSLAPGDSCDVVVRFAPHTLGTRSVELVATAVGASVTATLVGVALPELGLSATPMSGLAYGVVAVGATKTLRLTLHNGAAATARPYAVALAGADVQDFTIAADTCSGATNETCSIDVRFAPSVPSSRGAKLVVSSANLGALMIALDGTGYRPAQLAVSPASGMFGSVFEHGASSAQSFTVTNLGTVPTEVLQTAISGANASFFEIIDGCSGSPLVGGATCVFSIVYHASTVGMHQATVTVWAQSLVPVIVPLTGTGQPGQLQITPSGWRFGDVFVGQTAAAKTLMVENTGATNTGPLAVGFAYPTADFTILSNGCTGVDLAPGATCSLGVTATANNRYFSGTQLVVYATRGDTALAPLQIVGIIAAELTATPATAAFDNVQMTENPSQLVSVMNTGDLATGTLSVAVVGVDRADVALVEDCTGSSLDAFGGCSLTVSFSPSHLGAQTAAIQITSPGAVLTIPVTANVLPAPTFTVSPGALLITPAAVGQSYPRTFVVQGTGATTGPLTVATTGANAGDYVVTTDACTGQTLASGQACTVTLTLTPSGAGSRTATLVVSGSPGGYRKIPLTGIGFTQATLTISQPAVVFGATGVGQTGSYGFLTIRNTGQLPTGVLTAQLGGADQAEFAVITDTCTGTSLALNAECSVLTQFGPTKIANSTASLVVSAVPGGTVTTALSGTGLPPPVIASAITAYDFPSQETFTIRSTQIQIDNVGGSPTDHLRAHLTGPQADQFTASDSNCSSVSAGASCFVYVEFHPTTNVGQASATLVVDSALAGSATTALTGTALPGTKIVVTPDTFDFGFVAAGQSGAAKTFVATNIGQRDILMLHTYVPSGCDNFQVVSTTCGTTLAPNASCQTDVVLHPVSSSFGLCRLVFVDFALLKGEAQLQGQTSI